MILIIELQDDDTILRRVSQADISESFHLKLQKYHNVDILENMNYNSDLQFFEDLHSIPESSDNIGAAELLQVYVIWTS